MKKRYKIGEYAVYIDEKGIGAILRRIRKRDIKINLCSWYPEKGTNGIPLNCEWAICEYIRKGLKDFNFVKGEIYSIYVKPHNTIKIIKAKSKEEIERLCVENEI